jgi:hypothetical protein
MKVSANPITVIASKEAPELVLLMAGHRINLSVDEARALVEALGAAVAGPRAQGGAHGEAMSPPGGAHPAAAIERALPGTQPENGTIIAKVTEQLVSWSQIATALNSRK